MKKYLIYAFDAMYGYVSDSDTSTKYIHVFKLVDGAFKFVKTDIISHELRTPIDTSSLGLTNSQLGYLHINLELIKYQYHLNLRKYTLECEALLSNVLFDGDVSLGMKIGRLRKGLYAGITFPIGFDFGKLDAVLKDIQFEYYKWQTVYFQTMPYYNSF